MSLPRPVQTLPITYFAIAQFTTIISEVLNEIQHAIMKGVAASITFTTKIILQNLKQDLKVLLVLASTCDHSVLYSFL